MLSLMLNQEFNIRFKAQLSHYAVYCSAGGLRGCPNSAFVSKATGKTRGRYTSWLIDKATIAARYTSCLLSPRHHVSQYSPSPLCLLRRSPCMGSLGPKRAAMNKQRQISCSPRNSPHSSPKAQAPDPHKAVSAPPKTRSRIYSPSTTRDLRSALPLISLMTIGRSSKSTGALKTLVLSTPPHSDDPAAAWRKK